MINLLCHRKTKNNAMDMQYLQKQNNVSKACKIKYFFPSGENRKQHSSRIKTYLHNIQYTQEMGTHCGS